MLPALLKNKIINTYATQKDLELEARFGNFIKHRFQPGVTRQTFNRVKAYFDKNAQAEHVKTTDYIMGRVRKSVYTNGKTVWITKERVWNEENKDYGIRYSMSKEIPVAPITSHFVPEMIREKNRFSYLVFGDTVRIDLTIVNMVSSTKKNVKDDITFEVEVELIDEKALTNFEKAIGVTLRLILDTIILYTQKEKINIANEINSILGSNKRGYVDNYPLVQARNLKLRDMVYGGLIGNEKTGYSITHKADGERRMLYFSRSGVYLASPNSLTKLSDTSIPNLTGTILDGELVPLDKRLEGAPKVKFWFLAFDTLAWNNNKSVQDSPHNIRMQYAQEVANSMKGDLIRVNTKNFHVFETPDEFFKLMRDMFREQLILPYMQDGFMFTPENTVYNPHSDKYPLYKRKLSDYPDICKWKPKEELTIDLRIKWKAVPNGKILELYTVDKGNEVLFDKFNVDSENSMTINLPSNSIVEYGYNYEKDILEPRRVRVDKRFPNRKDVVEDVAQDIMNPLTKETMQGDTFTLLRKYHNSIKKKLFEKAGGKTLLDIGSGYGGDLGKWKQYSKIVAVEPDLEHIEELKKRLVTYEMQDKVKIVHAGGQETEKISQAVKEWIGDRVDTVSSMLSLTFFWQSSELVESLVQTVIRNIKESGKYIFLTMDGDLVEQTFEPAFGTGLVLDKLKLGPATLEYKGDLKPKELLIDIRGTIVEKQREWLVRLDDLKLRFGKYGFEIEMIHKANEEKFLTEEEMIMTKMYTYGMFGRKKIVSEQEHLNFEKADEQKIPVKSPSITSGMPLNIPEKEIVKEKVIPPPVYTLPPLKKLEKDKLPPLKKLPPVSKLPPLKKKKSKILPMDVSEKIDVTWYNEKVVRIGSIGDGSCYFHSVLNAYLKEYQINPDINFRKNFAKGIRNDLAKRLEMPDPDSPGKTYYETGVLPEIYAEQLLGLELEVDYSLEGIQKLLRSDSYLGDEIYKFAADSIGIDIYIMRLEDNDLKVHLSSIQNKKSVVIVGDNSHFETVGIERNGLYQTFFNPDDPFILKIQSFSKE